MEAHDPTNNRTLDLSGNGRHLTFGDGATANTFPTKMGTKRGYHNVSATSYLNNSNLVWSSSRFTSEILCMPYTRDTSGYLFDLRNVGSTQFLLGYSSATSFRLYSGGIAGGNTAIRTIVSNQNGVMHYVGRYDGVNTQLFENGKVVAAAVTPLAPQAGNPTTLKVFTLYDGSTAYLRFIVYYLRFWDVPLTAIEIEELYRKAKEELHRI